MRVLIGRGDGMSFTAFVCPECAHGAFEPFQCGGPHRYIRKDGKLGKRYVYRFVKAVECRPVAPSPASTESDGGTG